MADLGRQLLGNLCEDRRTRLPCQLRRRSQQLVCQRETRPERDQLHRLPEVLLCGGVFQVTTNDAPWRFPGASREAFFPSLYKHIHTNTSKSTG